MAECEQRLAEATEAPGGTLGEACAMTLAAGGKRLRPLLVLLTTKKLNGINEAQIAAGVAVELVHMATLVHDDVLDDAKLRRGHPTLVAGYGPSVSMTAGDYLFSRAFAVLAGSGSDRAVSLLTGVSLDLSLGELVQMEQAHDIDLSRDAYEKRCRLKTSGLFSAACQLGAVLSECSGATVKAMERFGHCIGLSFQISDDILDLAGEVSETGKRVGTDLRDGTVTLPLIMALGLDPSLATMFDGKLPEERFTEIVMKVRESGGLEKAREKACEYVEEAAAVLDTVTDELDTGPLRLIAEMTVQRRV
ncbi:MAG: polyprenyl synthetase family protein [Thermoleophilia bacterium]